MSPTKENSVTTESQKSCIEMQAELLSKFRINDSESEQPGKISGIDITNDDNILITDSWKRTITIFDQEGQCQFTKVFEHEVWDCACLSNGYFAVLANDCIKVFTDSWGFCQKIRVSMSNPRQLTADSDGFFIVLDADCKNLSVYHAKTGSLLSTFPAYGTVTQYLEFAVEDSPHLRRGQRNAQCIREATCKFEPMGTGLSVNSKDLIYIADMKKNTIRVFSHYGAECAEYNFPTNTKWQLAKPLGICIGAKDSIIVADSDNDRVLKFSADWAECEVMLDKIDGLAKPVAVALTSSKTLVIVDSETNAYVVKCD